jgi:4-amino-4-deoxy-L-arabinose transferase-like glycosyltransferase
LIALCAALCIVNLGGYPFYTKGEPREAVTVLDMVRGGGFILPMRAGVEIPSKPPLMHWIGALISIAAGRVNEWTIRMPSALLAIASILACYYYARALFGDLTGLLAALILATSFQFLQAGSGARVDMTLNFFIEIALFEFIMIAEGLRRRRAVMYLAASLAVLAKGPVGVVLPAMVGFAWLAYERRWKMLGRICLAWGIPLVLIVAGSWYAAAAAVRGEAFIHKQLLAENLFRFFHNSGFHEGHHHAFYYLEGALAAGFLPWTLIAPVVALWFARTKRPSEPRIRYLAAWCIVVLAFYSFPQSKRGIYLLALYPALAALWAVALARAASAPATVAGWVTLFSRIAGLLLFAVAVACATGLAELAAAPAGVSALLRNCGWTAAGLGPALAGQAARYGLFAVPFLIAIAAAGTVLLFFRARADRLTSAIAAGVASGVVIANLLVVPALAGSLSLRGFAGAIDRIVGNGTVAYLGGLNYDIAYYTGRDIPVVSPHGAITARYLICARSVYDAMPLVARAHWQIALESHPTSAGGSGALVLLRRVPAPGV